MSILTKEQLEAIKENASHGYVTNEDQAIEDVEALAAHIEAREQAFKEALQLLYNKMDRGDFNDWWYQARLEEVAKEFGIELDPS